MKIKNWIACVQDRGKWKEVVEKTQLSTRKFSAWKKKKKKKILVQPTLKTCTPACDVSSILKNFYFPSETS
jgi:hypothetical protein